MSWNVMECHGISWNLMECHGMSWNVTEFDFENIVVTMYNSLELLLILRMEKEDGCVNYLIQTVPGRWRKHYQFYPF